MTDTEEQDDELLALCHIYGDPVFTYFIESGVKGGQFLWCPELPEQSGVQINNTEGNPELHNIRYLPPVVLNFQLPTDYPSKNPPQFTLSSKWLTMAQLTDLCQKLDSIWDENHGAVVLFLWTNFLHDEAFDYLNLQFPLDLSHVLERKRAGSLRDSDNKELGDCSSYEHDHRAVQDIASQQLLLPTVLDYDKQEKRRQFDRSCFTCEVCFQEKLGAHCISFPVCDHVYCRDCMRDFFTIQINDGNVNGLICPADKCESQAHPSQVKSLVVSDLFLKYDQLLLQTSLQTMMDIVYCPRPKCQCPVIIDRECSMGSCPACYYVFCTLCKFTYHGLSPCKIRSDELRKLRQEYLSADEEEKLCLEKRYGKQTLKKAVEEAYSNEWLDQFCKQCPHCAAHIQKIDGCNKMTCMKCRTFFCWMCNALLSRNNPYSHFNQPGSSCFNRLFEGVEIDEDVAEWALL